jgi:hypothetical protein
MRVTRSLHTVPLDRTQLQIGLGSQSSEEDSSSPSQLEVTFRKYYEYTIIYSTIGFNCVAMPE